jgi:succinate dehydrogenase hydrophobic anchor subunit
MPERRVLKRQLLKAEGWRDTKLGMWAWLAQRAAAVALVAVIALHLKNPFVRPVQALLLGLVLLHGLLGVRAILLDFGLPVRWHRALLAGALGLGAVIFVARLGLAMVLKVFRWAPGARERLQEYAIPFQEGMTVLDALVDAQRRLDPTLAFRYACRVGMCGSCAMVIDGRERWACRTLLRSLGAGR